MSIIAGIDYSYVSPAICIWDDQTELKFDNIKLFNTFNLKKLQGVYNNLRIDPYPTYVSNEERFQLIMLWTTGILKEHKVESVNIEGYSLGSSSGLVFQIAENTSLLKNWLYLNDIPYDIPPPKTVKKFFTGNGNASKEDMVDEFNKRNNVQLHKLVGLDDKYQYKKPLDDIADSYAVMLYAKN